MAWNPSPKVADCRDIARKWDRECVIIISIQEGQVEIATYGKNLELCAFTKFLGIAAMEKIEKIIKDATAEVERERP